MRRPHQTRIAERLFGNVTLLLCLFMGATLTACDDEPTQAVDAAVDAGPECDTAQGGLAFCLEAYGARFFCNPDGSCQEVAPCETDACCSPGADGDAYCVETFGLGSVCEVGAENGTCTDRACRDCGFDNIGHECCANALGDRYFCDPDGRCAEADECTAEECCVPGAAGDAYCSGNFGDASTCNLVGNVGRCPRSSPPPCAGCRADADGHSCCQGEFGGTWFCGTQGLCLRSSGCMLDECCVPGSDGDAVCEMRFGAEFTCDVVDGDGRCASSN